MITGRLGRALLEQIDRTKELGYRALNFRTYGGRDGQTGEMELVVQIGVLQTNRYTESSYKLSRLGYGGFKELPQMVQETDPDFVKFLRSRKLRLHPEPTRHFPLPE